MNTFNENISQINRLPTDHVQECLRCRHSFINKGSTAIQTQLILFGSSAEKGPLLSFYSLHAFLMYRHESNDLMMIFYIYVFIFYRFPSLCHNDNSLVSSHSLLQFTLQYIIVKLLEASFLKKESHI